ncbi:MAG: glycosyltransferase family 4 protein [Salinivirgaceae bacterium]|jgi:glycosyltransferase involved in cell wall biosynthesis|nr:glycosyltransferase family 4 protein [Salinivirgaceae bacterium]
MSFSESKIIVSIAPTTLTRKVSGVEKNAYGPLDALGRIAKVICITDSKSTLEDHTFEIKPIIKRNSFRYISLKNYKLILNEVRTIKPGSLLLEQPFLGLITYWIAKKTNTPYFVHAHNIEYLRFKSLGRSRWPFVWFIEKFTLKRAKGVFFVTKVDRDLAIKKLRLDKSKCFVTPYGVPQQKAIELKEQKQNEIKQRHAIELDETIFMFFGALKYIPNIEAIEIIVQELLPRMKKQYQNKFKILVCGAGVSDAYKKQLEEVDKDHFIYAGFVNNIDEYIQTANVVMIPVLNRGGIKIRIIEALGFNKNVVSTNTGAIGVDPEHCGTKLYIAADNNWDRFTEMLIEATKNNTSIPEKFFEYYSWKAVAQTMLNKIAK